MDTQVQREESCERIFHGGTWRTRAHGQYENFRRWEDDGRIFGVEYYGAKYYADYQFDENGIPLPIIKEVLHRLPYDPWGIAAWFYFPNSWISLCNAPVSPKDVLLSKQDDVLQAAMRSTGSYVA